MNQKQTFHAIKFHSPGSSSIYVTQMKNPNMTAHNLCWYYSGPIGPEQCASTCQPVPHREYIGEPLDCQFAASSGILGGGEWVLPYWNRKSQLIENIVSHDMQQMSSGSATFLLQTLNQLTRCYWFSLSLKIKKTDSHTKFLYLVQQFQLDSPIDCRSIAWCFIVNLQTVKVLSRLKI